MMGWWCFFFSLLLFDTIVVLLILLVSPLSSILFPYTEQALDPFQTVDGATR